MSSKPGSRLPVRKQLDHAAHFQGRFGAVYFVTICCHSRGVNQLCREASANVVFETARRYHVAARCNFRLLLLMPDHLHALISVGGATTLTDLIRDFKRVTARLGKIRWQRNFFDHRLRNDENLVAKAAYIRDNPVRAGLIGPKKNGPTSDRLKISNLKTPSTAGDWVNRPYLKSATPAAAFPRDGATGVPSS